MLEPAVIRKKKQPFAVTIQSSHGIDIRDRNVILQSLTCTGKLAQNAIGLIEKDVAQVSDYIVEAAQEKPAA